MAGVYVHIPFCRKRCHYCDFYKTLDTGLADKYIDSLCREMELRQDYLEEDVETIYIGGGTPSLLKIEGIRKILNKIRQTYNIAENPEITVEVNPDDTSRELYRSYLREGVNRLSIGVQSWDDEVLKFLNRRHDAGQAKSSVNDALDAGFVNVSVDLIYGIPGLTLNNWEKTLDDTLALNIQHLSAYHLTIEKGTLFGKMVAAGEMSEIDELSSEQQFNMLVERSREKDFLQYEISNLCRDKLFSRHNTNYWKQVPYIGIGPSSHSYNGYSRQWNLSDLTLYFKSISGGSVPFEREVLDDQMKYNEYLMTSLRTMWGIDLEYVEDKFSKELRDYLVNLSNRFINYGMLSYSDKNTLVLTNQGKLISDNIISELMMNQDPT